MGDARRVRQPRFAYERGRSGRKSAKQRIHEMLRRDPTLSIEQLARAVGCPRAYARIWKKNFFAEGFEDALLVNA